MAKELLDALCHFRDVKVRIRKIMIIYGKNVIKAILNKTDFYLFR